MRQAPEQHAIAALILAAGGSSRLGQPKQLVKVNGQTLLERTIDALHACGTISPVLIVLGAHNERVRSCIAEPGTAAHVEFVVNPDWQQGMGSSIACGMQHLVRQSPHIRSVIISVCDQPFLDSSVIQGLIDSSTGSPGKIIASSYSGTMGPPVLFPQDFFEMLAGLSGDSGARRLLRDLADEVRTVDFPRGGVDLDTPADLDRLPS